MQLELRCFQGSHSRKQVSVAGLKGLDLSHQLLHGAIHCCINLVGIKVSAIFNYIFTNQISLLNALWLRWCDNVAICV